MADYKYCVRLIVLCGLLGCPAAQAKDPVQDVPVPVLDPQYTAMHQAALETRKAGELFKARSMFLELIEKYPKESAVQDVRKEFWNTNLAIIASPLPSRGTQYYTIASGDTLGKIARKLGTTLELIKRRNHMESDAIMPGHKLSVWSMPFTIHIDKSDNTLTLKTGGEIVKVYPVSTGKDNSSPIGQFTIKDRFENPVWFHKGEVVPANDPKNLLGTRWLGFDLPKYGIHGTLYPDMIGQQVSSGCIRMRNEDVQELYEYIAVGTAVTIED
jgi:hypothetical protein